LLDVNHVVLQPVYDMLTTSTSTANQRYTCVRTLTTLINHIKRTYPIERAADLIATDEAELRELQCEEESAKLLCNIPLYPNPRHKEFRVLKIYDQ